jgi:hypothetical protein
MFKAGLKTFGALQTLLCKTDRALTVQEFYQLNYNELQNSQDFEVLAPYLLRYREHTVEQEINSNRKIIKFLQSGVQAKEKELLDDDND